MSRTKLKRVPKPKFKPSKKFAGAVDFNEGPLDTMNHSYSSKNEIQSHLQQMGDKQQRLQQNRQRFVEKYNNEAQTLAVQKDQDFSVEQSRKQFENEKLMSQQQINATETANASVYTGNIFLSIMGFLKWLFENIIGFLKWLICKISMLLSFIWKAINDILKQTVNSPAGFAILCAILAIIVFFAIIAIIIYLIMQGIKSASETPQTVEEKKRKDTQNGKCARLLPDTIDINILKFSEMMNANKVKEGINSLKTYIENIKPKYCSITTIADSTDFWSDPNGNLYKSMSAYYNMLTNNEYIRLTLAYLTYYYYSIMYYALYLVGKADTSDFNRTTARNTIESRCDNINNVNCSIFPKSLLRSKKIDPKNTVINISRPNDIEWTLNDSEYDNLDLSKVPPFLMTMKDKTNNDMTLEDKKKIIIPWVIKDNFYVLSCEDAYFKNNTKEKANLFVDNFEDNTCTYNIQSVAKEYNEPKKRYAYTTDLSQFL